MVLPVIVGVGTSLEGKVTKTASDHTPLTTIAQYFQVTNFPELALANTLASSHLSHSIARAMTSFLVRAASAGNSEVQLETVTGVDRSE